MHGPPDASLWPDKEILVCGGAKVFEEAMPIATRLYLTQVKERLGRPRALIPRAS